MKNTIILLFIIMVVVSCKKDDEDNTHNILTYQGTTDQSENIILKTLDLKIVSLESKFNWVAPDSSSGYASFDKYDSKGLTDFINNIFTYTFPAVANPETGKIEEGSTISGTLNGNTFTGNYNISIVNKNVVVQGSFTAVLQ